MKILEMLKNNKWRIARLVFLLAVFFVITAYINGRNIYKNEMSKLENKTSVQVGTE